MLHSSIAPIERIAVDTGCVCARNALVSTTLPSITPTKQRANAMVCNRYEDSDAEEVVEEDDDSEEEEEELEEEEEEGMRCGIYFIPLQSPFSTSSHPIYSTNRWNKYLHCEAEAPPAKKKRKTEPEAAAPVKAAAKPASNGKAAPVPVEDDEDEEEEEEEDDDEEDELPKAEQPVKATAGEEESDFEEVGGVGVDDEED